MKYKFLSVEQFARVLENAPFGVVFDFIFDQPEEGFHNGIACGWFGAKKEEIFDNPFIAVGYYGGSHLFVRDLDEDIKEMLEHLMFIECASEDDFFCVEVTDENKKYLEEV